MIVVTKSTESSSHGDYCLLYHGKTGTRQIPLKKSTSKTIDVASGYSRSDTTVLNPKSALVEKLLATNKQGIDLPPAAILPMFMETSQVYTSDFESDLKKALDEIGKPPPDQKAPPSQPIEIKGKIKYSKQSQCIIFLVSCILQCR